MSKENLVAIASGAALLVSSSFILGQYVDHAQSYNNLSKLIQIDPYANYLKDKLIAVVSMYASATNFLYYSSLQFQKFYTNKQSALNRMQEIMKYGYPGLDDIRVFEDFVLSYDRRNRVAHWVMEHLTESCVANKSGVNRRLAEFRSDIMIPLLFRSHNYDYFRSGFDRGHLAAAANHKSLQSHCNETFLLCNIAPQIGRGFNRDAWNNLEMYVRGLTSIYPNVYVCTGSVYQPQLKANYKLYVEYEFIGQSIVAVPTHFFKVILCICKDNRFHMESYLLPNQFINHDIDLKTFRRPPEEIERVAGLQFFNKIARHQYVSINGNSLYEAEPANDP